MSRKSKNNRRKTQGRFTDNPKQYMQFLNRDAQSAVSLTHIIDEGHIGRISKLRILLVQS